MIVSWALPPCEYGRATSGTAAERQGGGEQSAPARPVPMDYCGPAGEWLDGTGRLPYQVEERAQEGRTMRSFTAVVERCPDTGFYVGYVPGFVGAHSQGETLDELVENLRIVIAMLLVDGEPKLLTEFVGTQNVVVA